MRSQIVLLYSVIAAHRFLFKAETANAILMLTNPIFIYKPIKSKKA